MSLDILILIGEVTGNREVSMACANANTPSTQLTQVAAEAAVLCLINEVRVAAGVPPLTLNLKLRTAARQHANAARAIKWWPITGGPTIHTNPVTGSTPKDRIRDAGYCPGEEAHPPNENGYTAWYRGGIEWQGVTSPQAALDSWMDSPPHRTTLLSPDFIESGVAVVLGVACKGPGADGPDNADGGVIIVQTFGGCAEPEIPHVGHVWGWGRNDQGQVGEGSTTDRHTAVQLEGITGVVALAGGRAHSFALRDDGSVLAWGHNFFGQLGDGTTTDHPTPVQVPSLNDVTAVAAGNIHSLALLTDGSVLAWGGNYKGQLGDGTTTDSATPVQVVGLSDAVAISAGWQFSLALTSTGVVQAWGENNFGQLGDGTTNNTATPVQVVGLTDVIAISAGFDHSLALKGDGSVWAWGANYTGKLGDGTNTQRLTPVRVDLSSSTMIVAIAAGSFHNLALEQNGRVWAWGDNTHGQLGTGDTIDSFTPVQPVNVFEVTTIASGFGHNMVLKRDGSVWAWGMNSYGGQLGDNTIIDRTLAVPVMGLPDVVGIAAGTFHSLAT
jgi:alpha-tubulin suppressor-like RCC1 family protein/uncharacterized protein YkwD